MAQIYCGNGSETLISTQRLPYMVQKALPFWEHSSHALPRCVIWRGNVPIPPYRSPSRDDYISMVESSLTAEHPDDILTFMPFLHISGFCDCQEKNHNLSIITQVLLSPTTNLIDPHVKEKKGEKQKRNQRWTRYGVSVNINCCLNPSLARLVDSVHYRQQTTSLQIALVHQKVCFFFQFLFLSE